MILQNKIGDDNKILDEAFTLAKRELKEHDSRYGFAEFERHINIKSLSELQLDKQSSIGYTYKCLGAALWAFKYGNSFKEAICQIVREAGDADTNAAVAGALMGAKYGYEQLPKEWIEGLLHRKWLDEKVDRFLGLLGLLE